MGGGTYFTEDCEVVAPVRSRLSLEGAWQRGGVGKADGSGKLREGRAHEAGGLFENMFVVLHFGRVISLDIKF